MAPQEMIDAPEEGGLDAVSVPQILAQAWRDERSGTLQLGSGAHERIIRVQKGAPISIESPRAEDAFARFLDDTNQISGADRLAVERFAQERECPHASAVLALKLLDAKALYQAMRAEARQQIAATFDWQTGQYRWQPSEASPSNGDQAKTAQPHDLLRLLQDELPKRWGSERLFQTLMDLQDHCGDISPRFRKIAQKLARTGEPAKRAIDLLDGTRPLGQILGDCAGDPLAAATLWTVLYSGVLRLSDGPANDAGGLDFEFEVEVAESGKAATGPAKSESKAKRSAAQDDKAAKLRTEIEALRGELVDVDHYSALGLDRDASPALIKKAYFQAAKKYHPDALARMGLNDLKEDAATVFARIAEAFETLSDEDKKRTYDKGGSEEPEIDTARLAQAETSFRKGEILSKMGNFEGALEYLVPAVELWPEEPAYQAELGWALYKQPQSDIEGATTHLEIACEQAPGDAVILFRLGLVMRSAGETNRANELIAQARSIQPEVGE